MSFGPKQTEKLTPDFGKLASMDIKMPKKVGAEDQTGDSEGGQENQRHTGGQESRELDRTPRGAQPCPKVGVGSIEPLCPPGQYQTLSMNRARLTDLMEETAPARTPTVDGPSNSGPKM